MSESLRNAIPDKVVALGVSLAVTLGGTAIAERLTNDSAKASSRTPPPLIEGEKSSSPPAIDDIAVVNPNRGYIDRFNACMDAVLAEPKFGLRKVPDSWYTTFSGDSLPPLAPYVELHTVKTDGERCDENMVQRRVSLFEKINGEKYPSFSHFAGNGDIRFLSVMGTREDQCGKIVQAGVLIEADVGGRVDGPKDPDNDNVFPDDIGRVYLSPERQVICED